MIFICESGALGSAICCVFTTETNFHCSNKETIVFLRPISDSSMLVGLPSNLNSSLIWVMYYLPRLCYICHVWKSSCSLLEATPMRERVSLILRKSSFSGNVTSTRSLTIASWLSIILTTNIHSVFQFSNLFIRQ